MHTSACESQLTSGISLNCFPPDCLESGSLTEPVTKQSGQGVILSCLLQHYNIHFPTPSCHLPGDPEDWTQAFMIVWQTLSHLGHHSSPCFHSWRQPVRGNTRKRSMATVPTLPPVLFLLLPSPTVTIRGEQLKAFALQTSVEMHRWECKAAQDSHNQMPFPEHRRGFFQRAVTTSAIRPLALFFDGINL